MVVRPPTVASRKPPAKHVCSRDGIELARASNVSLTSFLAKPSLRLPLLAATIVATVATSAGPPWERTARTDARIVHLEPGERADMTVAADGSHVPSVAARVEKLPSTGTLRIELADE